MARKKNRQQQQARFRRVEADESDAYIPKLEEFVLSPTEKKHFRELQQQFDLANSQLQVVLHVYQHSPESDNHGWVAIPYNAFRKSCSGVLKGDRLKRLKDLRIVECTEVYSTEKHICYEYRPGRILHELAERIIREDSLRDGIVKYTNTLGFNAYKHDSRQMSALTKQAVHTITQNVINFGALEAWYEEEKAVALAQGSRYRLKRVRRVKSYVNTMHRQGLRIDGKGIGTYRPAYTGSRTGRVYERGGGMQQMLSGLKPQLYNIPGRSIFNYDIIASHPTIVVELMKQYGVYDIDEITLEGYIKDSSILKQSYADQIGIPVDIWKDCFNSLWCGGFLGNNIQWSAVNKVIGKYTALHDLKDKTKEILTKFETLASPFIRTAKRWLSLIEETIVPELLHCNEQKKQCIVNAVGNVFVLSDEEQKPINDYIPEIAAFLLQGMESNYIFHLMVLADQYGYRILSNEHDGIVIESTTSVGLVDEIQKKAKIAAGLEKYELFPRLKETICSSK